MRKIVAIGIKFLPPEERAYVEGVLAGEYADDATLYAAKVCQGEIVAGPWVRLSCKQHLNDLARADLVWDVAAAQYALDFFEQGLVFTDGDKADLPFKLEPWQCFIVGCLFGWKGLDGWRRYRTAYIEVAKGNGKSPLAAGIGLLLLAADKEEAAEVYAAATKLDQAKILWTDAKRMAEASPILRDEIDCRQNLLSVVRSNSIFKPISSEKRGLDGPRVHGGLVDELHEHADATVVDKLRAGTKARKQALIVEITNSGYDTKSICYQHHELSIRILQGIAKNDSWFSFICSLDEGDEWDKDEDCWYKANPNLGVSITHKYLREQVNEARDLPAKRGIVARLNFCVWTGAVQFWTTEHKWTATLVAPNVWGEMVEAKGSRKLWLGADLSARRDLTALAGVWELPGGFATKVWYYTPKDGLEERSKRDRTPYHFWVEQGWITATPGEMVDQSFIAQQIYDLEQIWDVQGIAFDSWRIMDMQKPLEALGSKAPLIEHGQGFVGAGKEGALWMPRSVELLEEAVLKGTIFVENNPVSTYCSAAAQLRADPAGNRIFEKAKATGRMDGIVAIAMAHGLAKIGVPDGEGESVYGQRGLLVIGGN